MSYITIGPHDFYYGSDKDPLGTTMLLSRGMSPPANKVLVTYGARPGNKILLGIASIYRDSLSHGSYFRLSDAVASNASSVRKWVKYAYGIPGLQTGSTYTYNTGYYFQGGVA